MPRARAFLLGASCAWLLLGCASFEAARLYGSGSDALDRGDFARAIVDLERAAELRPQASEIHNHLGIAYTMAGRRTDARREFEKAVALDCDNDAAHRNLLALGGEPGESGP